MKQNPQNDKQTIELLPGLEAVTEPVGSLDPIPDGHKSPSGVEKLAAPSTSGTKPRGIETKAGTPPGSQPPRLAFSVKETAEMLGVSEKSVRRLVLRGLLKPSRALRHLRFTQTEIERFLRETM